MTEFQKKVVELLNEKISPSDIAKLLDVNKSSISSVIKSTNYDRSKINYKRNNTVLENYFDNIDTDIKAYLLGFFIADGSFSNKQSCKRFSITINSIDSDIIYLFKKELNISTKITIIPKNNLRNEQIRIRWYSSHMSEIFINKYNIYPRKTYDKDFVFPFELIPEIFHGSFIRGFLDGDGSFELTSNKNFNLIFVSTSEKFLLQIKNIICSKIDNVNFKINKHCGKTIDWYSSRMNFFRKNKSIKILKLYNFLYNSSKFSLNRKRNKIEEYLKYRGKL